jgi:hypothetical protein
VALLVYFLPGLLLAGQFEVLLAGSAMGIGTGSKHAPGAGFVDLVLEFAEEMLDVIIGICVQHRTHRRFNIAKVFANIGKLFLKVFAGVCKCVVSHLRNIAGSRPPGGRMERCHHAGKVQVEIVEEA